MRRVGIVLVGLLALSVAIFLAAPATAGEFHFGSTLRCNQCHVMHGSQGHGYNANGTGTVIGLGDNAPYHYLLRNDVNDLCLTCHDNSFAPDVFEDDGDPLVRQAAGLNRVGGVWNEAQGHTLDTMDLPPGNDGSYDPGDHGLVCTSCHHQHGFAGGGFPDANKGSYRNLRGMTSRGPTYALAGGDPTFTDPAQADVFVRNVDEYDTSDVDFYEPDPTASAYAAWCGNCHSDFHGAANGENIAGVGGTGIDEFVRHPVAGVNIGDLTGGHSNFARFATASRDFTGTKTNYVKVLSTSGTWQPSASTDTRDQTPSCMTCHKAHGNLNAFGLVYMQPTGDKTEEGTATGTYLSLCQQCHTQGT